jgi:hypothetical protein
MAPLPPETRSLPLRGGVGAAPLEGKGRDFDALADMFLGGGAAASASPPASASAPFTSPSVRAGHAAESRDGRVRTPGRGGPAVELVLLGHLPVRAAPWVGQYCRTIADERRERVAMVRREEGRLSIDVFEPGATASQWDETADVRAAAEIVRGVDRVIVRVDEIEEHAVASDPRIACVTVLAGGNEAAMVAAYRTFKELSQPHAVADGHRASPELCIAVVGTAAAPAHAAMARVREASAMFLGQTVRLAAVVERVGPTFASSIYRGAAPPGGVLDVLGPDASAAARSQPAHWPSESAVAAPSAHVASPALATGAHQSGHARAGERPALSTFFVGLVPTAARCPDDASVELAWGEGSTLHLLRASDAASGGDEAALASLLRVRGWAIKHAALLAMASGRDPHAGVTAAAHLFVPDLASARRAADLGVRVHVLARCESPWFCAEMPG